MSLVRGGVAFWRNGHPWLVLTESIPAKGTILCANLTTLDDECVDDECILHHEDYAWIKRDHRTAVAFSYAQAYDVQKLEKALSNGLLKLANPSAVPAATLQKIRTIAITARELSDDLKVLL